ATGRIAMVALDHFAQLGGDLEISPVGGAAIERQRRLGDGQRVAEMRVVIGGAGMAETAVWSAAVGQRPAEGAPGGVDQGAVAGDVVELGEACDRPAVLARIGASVDRR